MGWLSGLKEWQGLIGTIVGFLALIAGALFNARLNRQRDDRLRAYEARSVIGALYGEIILVRRSLAKMARFVAAQERRRTYDDDDKAAYDEHFRERVELPAAKLYDALGSKVGLLPPELAFSIGKFYQRAEDAKAWLPRLQEKAGRKYSYSVSAVLRPAVNAVRKIEQPLGQMEQIIGLTTMHTKTPDLGYADDVLEEEEARFKRPPDE